ADVSQTRKTRAVKTMIFTVRVENDGSASDSFIIHGGGSAKGYTVTYLIGTGDYTTKIVNGNLTLSVPAGTGKLISMRVKVGSAGKASWSSLVQVTAEHQPSKVDAV